MTRLVYSSCDHQVKNCSLADSFLEPMALFVSGQFSGAYGVTKYGSG